MPKLGDVAQKVRSKNAGPFWLTVDIFCGDKNAYKCVVEGFSTLQVARIFRAEPQLIKRFDIPDLNVVKFSLPRPKTQGASADRDIHGASWAALLTEAEIGTTETRSKK